MINLVNSQLHRSRNRRRNAIDHPNLRELEGLGDGEDGKRYSPRELLFLPKINKAIPFTPKLITCDQRGRVFCFSCDSEKEEGKPEFRLERILSTDSLRNLKMFMLVKKNKKYLHHLFCVSYSGTEKRNILIFNVQTGALVKKMEGVVEGGYSIREIDENRFVTTNYLSPFCVNIFDFNTLKCIHSFRSHTSDILNVYVLPNDMLASVSWDMSIVIYSIKNYKVLTTLRLHKSYIYGIACSERYLVTCSYDDYLMVVWDITRKFKIVTKINMGFRCYRGLALDGNRIICGSTDKGIIKVFSIPDGALLKTLKVGEFHEITGVKVITHSLFSKDEFWIALSNGDVDVLNVKTGKTTKCFAVFDKNLSRYDRRIDFMEIYPDEQVSKIIKIFHHNLMDTEMHGSFCNVKIVTKTK